MSGSNIYSVNWYPREYPQEGDTVTVKLVRIDEMGIWVELLEYGSKEGMIPLCNYTQRRSHRIPKSVHIGKIDVAIVAQVDEEKRNMDLTRSGLKPEDIQAQEKKFNDYKNLIMLLKYLADNEQIRRPLQELVAAISYPLQNRYQNAYQALQRSFREPEIIDALEIDDQIRTELRSQIDRMFTPQETRIHALFEAEVHSSEGVEALRDALVAGYDIKPDSNLQIHVVAPPLYSAHVVQLGDDGGVDLLNDVLKKIEEKILAAKGRFVIKEKPKAISQSEQLKFQQQLDDLAAQDNANTDIDEAELGQ